MKKHLIFVFVYLNFVVLESWITNEATFCRTSWWPGL